MTTFLALSILFGALALPHLVRGEEVILGVSAPFLLANQSLNFFDQKWRQVHMQRVEGYLKELGTHH